MCCMAGGDKANLHNLLRDSIHHSLRQCGFDATREDTNLLPDDPLRRPGDINVPRWSGGTNIAIDVAVTCPLQQGIVEAAAQDSLVAAACYEDHKRNDRQTAVRCQELGIELTPVVAESFGGWGETAQNFFKTLARLLASRQGKTTSECTNELYQSLNVKIMRANARAVMSRIECGSSVRNSAKARARRCLATRRTF